MGPGGPHGGPPHPPPPFGPTREELERVGLTDAQRDKLADLHDDEMRKVIRLDAEARIAEHDLRRLLEADRSDASAIQAQVEHATSARAEILEVHVATIVALRELLTAEQRTRLRRLRSAPESREP